ncbi:MucR family transcriptional regulator [Methylobacterium planeticum]|uniref:MucR family transcriptional regulator n=1 Tax=Methylobacterium planeticum TaxID=2615211 RepID=A0A6N6MEV1_9HYPH|nr:MucR family transcriptional regulator [Methylobacterium planeticum]KAB1067894.1 MucR family transcriptional regulator [Methylobacterium planeticum]
MAEDAEQNALESLTAKIASAYFSHNHAQPAELLDLIRSVHGTLLKLASMGVSEPKPLPKLTAAAIRRSIAPDYLISFEDGKRYKALRRHLIGRGLTPEMYRAKWGLPSDYPMVTSSYSAHRAELARSIGLGKSRRGNSETDLHRAAQVESPEERSADARTSEEGADAITREPFEDDGVHE